MRRKVLEVVHKARVFDAFCGRGVMYREAWKDAVAYVGCDLSWEPGDARRRFVADNRRVMRAVDLSEFNVFDFDAFGSPWEQMLILAARRKWAPGERGAVVLTDGSSLKSRFGVAPRAMAQCAGTGASGLPASMATSRALESLAVARWLELAGVKPTRKWRAEGRGSGRGSALQVYSAICFEGVGPGMAPGIA